VKSPTEHEIEDEARRCKPWLFASDLDLSGRRQMLGAMQEAEDRLRQERGLELKYSEI
jgi:hypothetical protein